MDADCVVVPAELAGNDDFGDGDGLADPEVALADVRDEEEPGTPGVGSVDPVTPRLCCAVEVVEAMDAGVVVDTDCPA